MLMKNELARCLFFLRIQKEKTKKIRTTLCSSDFFVVSCYGVKNYLTINLCETFCLLITDVQMYSPAGSVMEVLVDVRNVPLYSHYFLWIFEQFYIRIKILSAK